MPNIFYLLQALYQFYKSSHWLAKGEYFYQDHLLFERLYESLDDEMDKLVELQLGLDSTDKDFEPKLILEQSAKLLPKFGSTCAENIQIAVGLEEKLLKELQKVRTDSTPIGLYNHFAAIGESHTRNCYLLSRILLERDEE